MYNATYKYMRELGISHRITQTKPYKLIYGKKTKTYGLVGLDALLRQGRSLSLPTLPYQQTNRYAVVSPKQAAIVP